MNVSATLLEQGESEAEKDVDIETLVKEASTFIGPVWPLKNGIACNPLLSLEDQEFWKAIEEFEKLYDPLYSFNKTDDQKVNLHFIKWIQAFLDEGQATWNMPDRHLGFYRSWRLLAPYDRLLIKTDRERKILSSLPENPDDAVAFGLNLLGVQNGDRASYLAQQLGQLPGWAGYVKWQIEWNAEGLKHPIDLVQFLAVRIAISCLIEGEKPAENKSSYKRSWTRQEIELRENEYAIELVANLSKQATNRPFSYRKERPFGQLVFCIDVRSEPFRKQLEAQGPWETFGFAGFFGIPISLTKDHSSEKYPSCPVLLKPAHHVEEISSPSTFSKWMGQTKGLFRRLYKSLKYQFGTPFALAEAIGPWSGIWMILKSFSPKTALALQNLFQNTKSKGFCCLEKNIPLDEQVKYAQSALQMIGLTQDFAPLVIFCGHGAAVQNNPHASALNCGACGGNPGGPNARLIASILNSASVRGELEKRGIKIPKETFFIGAEHDTTTDYVTLFDRETDMKGHSNHMQRLKDDLKKAQKGNAANRMQFLGSHQGKKDAIRKSVDWSETRPEWGLAKNAAFLVGPRTLTENLDLEGRCFLHSYDWRSDSDGTSLETILTAPMVVAEWINTQYFFSAFHPVAFGSGSKITHNVVGKIGVMQGNGSDLMHGLPIQSIQLSDSEPYHLPMRLLTVVFAPKIRLNAIIKKHVILQNLFFNGWVKLICLDPSDSKCYQLQGDNIWKEIESID